MTEEQTLLLKTGAVILVAMVLGGSGIVAVLWGVVAGVAFGASMISTLKVVGAGLGLIAVPVILWWFLFRR
jgi:hypothetical protein